MNESITLSKKEKKPVLLTGILSLILIVTFIFTLKNYEPAKNIIITGGIITYPLSFLIIAIISKYYGSKEARKSIYTSSTLYLIFMILIIISIMPAANELTSGYNAIVQYIFAANFKELSFITIFYPIIGQFISIIIAYLASHLLFATIYSITKSYTMDYLAMGLALFISYIVDRIIFVPILFSKGLLDESITFNYLIQILTSEFIAAVFMTIILIIIYIIITSIKKMISDK